MLLNSVSQGYDVYIPNYYVAAVDCTHLAKAEIFPRASQRFANQFNLKHHRAAGRESSRPSRLEIVPVEPGVCITIPLGTRFQLRSVGNEPLVAVGVTIPTWPGQDEATVVSGEWRPTSPETDDGTRIRFTVD